MKENNKKTTFDLLVPGILFTLILIILVIFGINFYLDEEEFIITKTECREIIDLNHKYNEEKLSSYLLDDKKIPYTYGVESYSYSENDTALFFRELSVYKCQSLYLEDTSINKRELISTENCAQKKVEEINTKIKVKECVKDINKLIEECKNNIKCIENNRFFYTCVTKVSNSNITEIYKLIYINKKDLTKKWLNNNTECISYCNKRW